MAYIWGLWHQKHISEAGFSSGIPQYLCVTYPRLRDLLPAPWSSCVAVTTNKLFPRKMMSLTHWGRGTHICVSKLTIMGSENGLSPGRRQAIIWTIAGLLLFRPLATNFSENLIKIHTFSFKKINLKMSSGIWRPFCLGINELMRQQRLLRLTKSYFIPGITNTD